ncbi:hypothetical protein ACJJTC_005612 [Scirpophaga incertulas]
MFHKGKYYVTFKRGFEDFKKDITIVIDKVFERDVVKIILSDDEDPAFLCIIVLTRCDYEELKKQQGLLIDFDNFPSQVVKLFQQCASNNMFLQMQQTNPVQYYLEIIEHNEFKRLVHLSLKTGPATDADIKQNMAETIINLKKTVSSLKNSASSSDALWNDKCIHLEQKVHQLSNALSQLEDDKIKKETEFRQLLKQENEKLTLEKHQWQKNIEISTNAQLAALQDNLSRKDKQLEELNLICKQLQENIRQFENQLSEKTQRINLLENEVQKTHIEVATLKARNESLEKELTNKEKQSSQLSTRCSYLEQTLKENSEIIKDLNVSLQIIKKEKVSLQERLVISESLANKNNEAAHSSSEQLLKANQIISKQNADLMEIKEKLLCRTAIALEQEKVIEQNSKEIEDLKNDVHASNQNLEKLRVELNALTEKCKAHEITLKDRDETIKNNNMVIQWLHQKVENNCGPSQQSYNKHGINTATSSTPYFLSNNIQNSGSHDSSDMSINFYASSKSNIEDSPAPNEQERRTVGLDPKYLRPVDSDHNVEKTNAMTKSAHCGDEIKGKENKTMNLPKVIYREKKSSRSSTYKATPVSAYFP